LFEVQVYNVSSISSKINLLDIVPTLAIFVVTIEDIQWKASIGA